MIDSPLGLPSQLTFTSTKKQSQIMLNNTSLSQCIIFKIKSTHPDELELRVFEGSVMPSSQRSITIEIKNVQANRDKKMKLLVQWAQVPVDMKDKKIETLPKSQISAKQILIVENENTDEQSKPVQSKYESSVHKETKSAAPVAEPSTPSQSFTQTIQVQRARNTRLTHQTEQLHKQLSHVRETNKALSKSSHSNFGLTVLIMLVVFFGVYYVSELVREI